MTMSCAQIVRASVAKYCSIARRARFRHYLCRRLYVAHQGSPVGKLSRNLCSNLLCGKAVVSSPKAFDNSPQSDHLSGRLRLGVSIGKVQSKSIAYWLFSAQMTTSHPVPMSWLVPRLALALATSQLRAGARRLFFDPTAYSVAGHPEGATQAAQARAFFIGAQYFIAFLFSISVRLRVITTTSPAIIAVIALFTIPGQAIAHQIVTTTMATLYIDCNHRMRLPSLTLLSHYLHAECGDHKQG